VKAMQKLTILLITFLLLFSYPVLADFKLTGKVEQGNSTYISNEEELSGEVLDYYSYDNVWFKVKKKLDYPSYYYLKTEYYQKSYDEKTGYDNETIDLIGNYTQKFNDIYRNKFKVSLKDKEYINNTDNSYTSYTLSYQFRHQLNDLNRYTLDFQTKEYMYKNDSMKDYYIKTYKINWEKEINDKFEIEFGYQIKEEKHKFESGGSNKIRQKYSIDFKYDL
jgi:hypothetical protein